MDTDLSFGEWLRRRRGSLGLTRASFAKMLGCATVTLRKVESEERKPSLELAQRIADVLEILPDQRAAFVRYARGELRAGRQMSVAPVSRTSEQTHRLPQPPYPLIGRAETIARAESEILGRVARVLTLCGPPGVGKTRLALELAHRLRPHFDHGAVFVELTSVEDATRVPDAIAAALRLTNKTAHNASDAIVSALADSHLLLVLDNFEHVLSAAPFLADLIARCSSLTCIVTSRERLRIRSERALRIDVLAGPANPSLEAIRAAPASQLLVARMEEANSSLNLVEADAEPIAAICARLDGLPLALELLAARADRFSPSELLIELGGGLDALEYAPRDLPKRQRGLRTAIAWSLSLLSAPQRVLFARLAVFVGGLSSNALQAVYAHAPDDLASLASASLIQPLAADRWRALEPIRQVAAETLANEGQTAVADASRRHAAHFAEVALQARTELLGPDAENWTARIEADHANFQSALLWSLRAGAPEYALQIGQGIFRFWHRRGMWREALSWLEQALAADARAEAPSTPDLRLKAARAAGVMAHTLCQYERAELHYRESLVLARAAKDDEQVAAAFQAMGTLAADCGRFDDALQHFDAAIELEPAHALKFPWQSKADLLQRLERLDEASALYQKAMALNREIQDDEGVAHTLRGLAEIALRRGEPDIAWRLLAENEVICHRLRNAHALTTTHLLFGDAARLRGDTETACERYAQTLEQAHTMGEQHVICKALIACARLAIAVGRLDLAARMLAMAQAGHAALGTQLTANESNSVATSLAQCAAALPARRLPRSCDAAKTRGMRSISRCR